MNKFNKISVLILLLLMFLYCSPLSAPDVPAAVGGIIDLSQWDFINNGPVDLNGEWSFYPNQLLTPDDLSDSQREKQVTILPYVWDNKKVQPNPIPGKAYATYRLRIKVNSTDEIFAIKMGEVYSAYKLWIDGKLVFSTGIVGKSKAESRPVMRPHTTRFTSKNNTFEIIIQISNYHYKNGGIRNAIRFGLGPQMTAQRERSLILNYILFGSVLIMALYHFGLFSLHRKDKSTLLFGLFCLFVASRVIVTDESYLTNIFPNLYWGIHLKFIVLGYYLSLPIFLPFVYHLFPDEFHQPTVKIFQNIGLAGCSVVLFTPMSVYLKTELAYQIFIIIGFIYGAVGIIKAGRNKRQGVGWFAGGYIVLFLTALNDILYANYSSNMQNMLPMGLFIFIFSQSYMISVRFTNAFKLAARLEHEKLEAQTKALVAERKVTELLEQQVVEKENQVDTLTGLLPICASCKKIRDDKGYWQQVEKYVSDHTKAQFSHGICPDCMEKLYPDFAKKMKEGK